MPTWPSSANTPHVHDLANGPTVAKADHPLLQQAAIEYWNLLHDTIADCQPSRTTEGETLRRAAVTWSTVYGISRLSAFGQLPASIPATADQLVHDAIDPTPRRLAPQETRTKPRHLIHPAETPGGVQRLLPWRRPTKCVVVWYTIEPWRSCSI
jgi:hypothetical protein